MSDQINAVPQVPVPSTPGPAIVAGGTVLKAPTAGNTVTSLGSQAAHEVAAQAQALEAVAKRAAALEEAKLASPVKAAEVKAQGLVSSVSSTLEARVKALEDRITHFNTRSGQKI